MEDQKPLVFTLFRVQIHVPESLPLLSELRSPQEIITAALMERPSVAHAGGSWHIGNVTEVFPTGLYFAIGKQLPRNLHVLDEAGDFQSQSAMVAPNTHALFDLHYQLLAIAKNAEVAPKPESVAKKLQRLLQATSAVENQGGRVAITLINDPQEFLGVLVNAAAVTKFQVTYGLPNVWDAEADFQKPFQETSRALGSETSTATFKGTDLEREGLVKLTRAAAAIGKKAKAWVRRIPKARPVAVTTGTNPATIAQKAPDSSHPVRWAQETLMQIRQVYEDIRRRE